MTTQATPRVLEPIVDGAKCFIRSAQTGKYLLVLRDNNPQILNPNKWSLFGGGANPGETPAQAVVRELFEEAKIVITDLKYLGNTTLSFARDGKSRSIHIALFLGETSSTEAEINRDLCEGQMAKFFTLDEVMDLDTVPGLKESISQYGLLNAHPTL